MTRVRSSSIRYSTKSQSSRSAWLPTDTQWLKPTPISRARSKIVAIRAPLWLMKPIVPTGRESTSSAGEEHSTSLFAGLITPRQLGPISRMPCARAAATISRSSLAPSAPASENFEVMMMPPRAPRAAAASISGLTLSRGSAITTMSGGDGVAETDLQVGMPKRVSRAGLTG